MKQSEFVEILEDHGIQPDPNATFTEVYREIANSLDGMSQRQARRKWNQAIADLEADPGGNGLPETEPEQSELNSLEDVQKAQRLDSMPQPPEDGGGDGEKPESWADVDTGDLERVPTHRTKRYRAFMHWPSREYWFVFPDSEPFDIPFEEIQQMIRQYVHAGAGQTQKQVTSWAIRKLDRDLTADYFDKIVRSLGMDKNSPPFAPHVIAEDGDDPDSVAQRWREHDEAAIEARYRAGEVDHYRDRYETLKKRWLSVRDFVRETVESAGFETIETDAPDIHLPDPETPRIAANPIHVLSDWHVAKLVECVVNGEVHRFDYEVAQRRVMRLCEEWAEHYQFNRRPADRAVVAILGDMIDGPAGDMFPEQFRGQEFHGREQCVKAADLLAYAVNFLDSLLDVPVVVKAIGGNHGRSRKNNSEDPTRLPELLTYEIAREKTAKTVDWTIYESTTGRWTERNTEVVITHGDSGPRDLRDLGWVSRAESVLILSGHSHQDQRDGVSDRHVYSQKNGCLCGLTKFDRDELAKLPRPTQSLVEVRDSGPVPGPCFYLDDDQRAA